MTSTSVIVAAASAAAKFWSRIPTDIWGIIFEYDTAEYREIYKNCAISAAKIGKKVTIRLECQERFERHIMPDLDDLYEFSNFHRFYIMKSASINYLVCDFVVYEIDTSLKKKARALFSTFDTTSNMWYLV
jgi:hypothetical protein